MLLTITLTRPPATGLGFLLHKHAERIQSSELPFGAAHVFYPEATDERCTAALLLDVDPVGLVRRGVRFGRLDQCVNDQPTSRRRSSALRSRAPSRERLRRRSLGRKRSLAVREFGLGIEALERFVREEPLRRVHECCFAVLAFESEPVDPRP